MVSIHSRIRRLRDDSGQSLLEAAIITPLLLLLTFAIVDFAAMLYVHLALQNGVAQASRYGVTGRSPDPECPARTRSGRHAEATPTLTLPDAAFSFSNLPPGGGAWIGGLGGAERHRQGHGQLHLDDSHAGAEAVLSDRPDQLHRRVDHEEREGF